MNLDEAKPNGHAEPVTRAWDARLARIEQRLADIAGPASNTPALPRLLRPLASRLHQAAAGVTAQGGRGDD
jgi:hypothetical protein